MELDENTDRGDFGDKKSAFVTRAEKRASEFLGGPGKRGSEFLGGPGKRASELLGGPGKRLAAVLGRKSLRVLNGRAESGPELFPTAVAGKGYACQVQDTVLPSLDKDYLVAFESRDDSS